MTLVDQNVTRAIHGFEAEALLLDFKYPEHILGVVFKVPGDFENLFVHDVRRDDRQIPAFAQALADEVLNQAAHNRALWVPENKAAAGLFLNAEEIELLAKLTM